MRYVSFFIFFSNLLMYFNFIALINTRITSASQGFNVMQGMNIKSVLIRFMEKTYPILD